MVNLDLISFRDIDKEFINKVFEKATIFEHSSDAMKYTDKIVFTLFFEPSTRTRLSFQTAAKRLGCKVVDFNEKVSSTKKGESLKDTIKIIDSYGDLLILRSEYEGAARFAADISKNPVVNAGDGSNQHPSQTLIDLYTIKRLKGRIKDQNVFLFGDLKHARTMHSLIYGLAMFGANIYLVSPYGLEMDANLIKEVEHKFNVKINIMKKLDMSLCDVLYVCRIQKERFQDPYEAKKVQDEFKITKKLISNAKKDMIILHPLPKIDEVEREVDESKYAKYFEQAAFGIPVRMAIIDLLLSKEGN